jgi:hypothetical protein
MALAKGDTAGMQAPPFALASGWKGVSRLFGDQNGAVHYKTKKSPLAKTGLNLLFREE